MATQTPIQGETRRNGYFCLFNRGGGSTQVFEQGRSRGESTRKGRPVLSESRLTQTSQEVFSISKPADTQQGLQTPIRGLQTLPSTTGVLWAELAASGDSGSAEPQQTQLFMSSLRKAKSRWTRGRSHRCFVLPRWLHFPQLCNVSLHFPEAHKRAFSGYHPVMIAFLEMVLREEEGSPVPHRALTADSPKNPSPFPASLVEAG